MTLPAPARPASRAPAASPTVVKLGGRTQGDPALVAALGAAWRACEGALVVVHGGGDEVSALQRAMGAEPRFVGGRRVTEARDLDLLRMALSGVANKRLVAALVRAGVAAVGISGEDAGLLVAAPADPALGFVGTPAFVEPALVRHLLAGGFLPVVSPLARRADVGRDLPPLLNVNGDDAAAALAAALGAAELLLVADVPGVLVDGVAVAHLDGAAACRLVADGTARGGMAAKLEAALAALGRGVPRVRIGDRTLLLDPDAGTLLTSAALSPSPDPDA